MGSGAGGRPGNVGARRLHPSSPADHPGRVAGNGKAQSENTRRCQRAGCRAAVPPRGRSPLESRNSPRHTVERDPMTRHCLERGILVLAMITAPVVFAHGGQEHVMGTVVSADAKSIVVKTTKGAETTIRVDDKTQVERSGKPAKLADISAGQRVVVHARKGQDGLTAVVIK